MTIPFVRYEMTATDDPECGIGVALWVAGCSRRCPSCQNPSLQDPAAGMQVEVSVVLEDLAWYLEQAHILDCVVFMGGEWMLYPDAYVEIATWAQSRGLRTVLYTGDIFEMLPESVRQVSEWVIDGPWCRDMPGVFPASTNQRVFHRGELVNPEGLPLYQHLAVRVT